METTEINDFVVKKVKVPELPNTDEIAGGRLFPQLYYNAFICARKKSGKTVCLSSIILNSINKKTSVIFFVPTHGKDFTYQHIFDRLDAKKINYTIYSDIIDENGVNILNNMIDGLLQEDPEVKRKPKESSTAKQVQEPTPTIKLFNDDEEAGTASGEKKERKPKKKAPKYLIVIDDCSQSTRDPSVSRLLKVHRHLKSSVLISSQNTQDLQPASWRQLDYLLIFGGFSNNLDKLRDIYINMDLPIEFEDFVRLYRDATSEKYNFLWCSKEGIFRKNFNRQYVEN